MQRKARVSSSVAFQGRPLHRTLTRSPLGDEWWTSLYGAPEPPNRPDDREGVRGVTGLKHAFVGLIDS
jgi:hypothetical protein